MRPSSSRSEPDLGLFDGIQSAGPVREALSDRQVLRRMLRVEAALAEAGAAAGLIPPAAAAAISAVCAADRFHPDQLARAAAEAGNPVIPLVAALRAAVGEQHRRYVHFGATSQDILDTATMLGVRDALRLLREDLATATGAAARLARAHRDTPMAGRTLLQHALPVTFGLVAAGWLGGLATADDQLRAYQPAVQFGGPVGTLDAYPPELVEPVSARLATTLELAPAPLPWHTDRTRIGILAGALGTTAGAVGKVARDVTLLAGSDVGELAEAAPGGSSAMPHKRNPVASIAALACAAQAPGLVATLLASMVQEHQRAAGAWHAEWRPLRELLTSVGSATRWLSECLAGLRVDAPAMAANLDRLATTAGLADPSGRLGAAGALVDAALIPYQHRETP